MKENPVFPYAYRGCFISLASIVLAICFLILSVSYKYPEHPLCRGGLGAGFPLLFICDAGLGGSPISSWGKITLVDVPNGGIRPGGFLLDFLFYLLLVWIVGFPAAKIFHRGIHRRDLWWTGFISIIYITGFLCGSLVFFSSELYSKSYSRTATPDLMLIPSPTPLGTLPSAVTPIATSGP